MIPVMSQNTKNANISTELNENFPKSGFSLQTDDYQQARNEVIPVLVLHYC